jgi:beta-lactamase regulating signal transducer with metallopeptidase domain
MMAQLARHLLESTAFALVVALFPRSMRKSGASARYAVWLIAAAKFAVPAELFSAAGARLHALFLTRPLLVVTSPVLARIVSAPVAAPSTAGAGMGLSILLGALWLAGSATTLILWIRRLITLGEAVTPAGEMDQEAARRLGRQIGLRRTVRLRYSSARTEPSVSGIWRPTITIPQGLRGQLTAAEFEAVLLHELAHAKREDNLSMAFVHTLTCLLWFHPLLWWIERQLLRERERACDELVVRHRSVSEDYVTGILKVCRFYISSGPATVCGVSGSELNKRLEAIMSLRSSDPKTRVPRFLLGALACWMTIVPLGGGLLSGSNLRIHTAGGGGQTGSITDNSKDQAMLAVNIIRVINTAEVVDCRTKDGKVDETIKFLPWDDLRNKPCFKQAQQKYSRPAGNRFSEVSQLTFSAAPAIVPGLELRLVVSPDGSHYNVWLGQAKGNCGFAFYSDERGLIYEASALGCNQAGILGKP